MSDLNSTFIITMTSLLLASFGVMLRLCFKSKCSDVNICCGLLKFKRNVDDEIKIEQIKIEHNIKDEDDVEKQQIK